MAIGAKDEMRLVQMEREKYEGMWAVGIVAHLLSKLNKPHNLQR